LGQRYAQGYRTFFPRARRSKLSTEEEVLRREVAGLLENIRGYSSQAQSTTERRALFAEELKDKQGLLARQLATEDQPSDVELDVAAAYPELYGLICDERDQLLIQALMEIHEQRNREPIKVAVVYGALHMPAVLHAMSARHRYLARDGEFLNVFDL